MTGTHRAPHTSALYWCTRTLPFSLQQIIALIFELAQIFRDSSERYQEAEVARLKLLWWQEELKLLFQNAPRHPITQALSPYCQHYQLTLPKFNGLLQGALNSLEWHHYETQTELEQHFSHTGGLLASLMGHVLSYPHSHSADEEHLLIQTGTAWEIIRHLVDFSIFMQYGTLPLPFSDLAPFTTAPQALLLPEHHSILEQLLRLQTDRARTLSQPLFENLHPTWRPLRQYTRIQLALLDKIEQDHFQVLHHQWHLGLLKKFWISWRTA